MAWTVVASFAVLARPQLGAGAAPAPTADRPNVVVIMLDDMRVDDLRFAPHARRLIGGAGITFENSFSPYPLCCPARASFLTGTYAHNHGVLWHEPPSGYAAFDDSRTLATSLAAVGYRTGYVGKYLNGYGPMRSLVSGEPSYRYVPRGWTDWRASIDPRVRGIHGGTYHYFDLPLNVNGHVDNTHRGEYSSNVIGAEAVVMEHRFAASEAPFFLYVNFVAPHLGGRERGDPPSWVRDSSGRRWDFRTPGRPRRVRGHFDGLIDRGAGMPRGGGPAERDISDKPASFRNVPEPGAYERWALRELTRQRAESVYATDRQVALLLRALRETGAWDDTVVVFTSDNGYFLGEHRRRSGKIRAHEPSLRVPLLVTGPGMRSGEHRYDPASTVDLTATIVDLAGARPPRTPDGHSLVPALRGGDQGWHSAVVTESGTPGRLPHVPGFDDKRTAIGLRTARFSYIVNRREGNELYDLLEDPLENRNVYNSPSYRTARRQLASTWTTMRDCAGDSCQIELPGPLAVTAQQERHLARHYWRVVDRTYGWG
ncbi:MAG TPA: sulfatase [Nocardioides sp.]|nr:sulfatase [Nocardioides sp.]